MEDRRPDPDHTGLRPLGPHGEGYCRVCCFVIGLTARGLLEEHQRGAVDAYGSPQNCKGSSKPPAKVTPYASRKAAFRYTPNKAWCPECRQDAPIMPLRGIQVYARHPAGARLTCSLTGHRI